MYCPEQIVFRSGLVILAMYGDADIPRKHVPASWWLNPLRYSATFFVPVIGKRIHLNCNGVWNKRVGDFLYTHVRRRLCKLFGIHQPFKFRGGASFCHHCDKGRESWPRRD